MNIRLCLMAGIAASTILSAPVAAVPLSFDFSGPSGTALFQLDSNPIPDFATSFLGSEQFGFNNVAGTFAGVAGVASTISFGSGFFANFNVVAPGIGFTQFLSPTLFTGTAAAPMFTPGSYVLVNPFFGNGTLTIASVAGAVPEPLTWTLMVVGFGAIGLATRRRQQALTVGQGAAQMSSRL